MKLIYHTNPDQAVRDISKRLLGAKKKEGEKAYWAGMAHYLKTDIWFLIRVGLQWGFLDEDLTGHKLIKHLADNWGEDIALLLPRGHGKTLPMSAVIIQSILQDPGTAVLGVFRTDKQARKFGEYIGGQLMENDLLQRCFGRKHNKNGFLPSSLAECSSWGLDGYRIPYAKQRLDHTLSCIPLDGAKAGRHPDWIYLDDLTEKENNDERGWENVKEVINGLKMTLGETGFFVWSGTRWHDSDPIGGAEEGKFFGKRGAFNTIKFSCYVDDNPAKGCIYPEKIRWNETKPSGRSLESLDRERLPRPQGMGEFFDAQMRNDPKPAERMDIKISDINIYEPDRLPRLGGVRTMGVETTGGGLPIYQGLLEHCEQMKFFLPLEEITNPRKVGLQKKDRIIAAIQPLTHGGKLYVQRWMMGDETSRDTLGYEIRRLGVATHDDILDALHNVPAHLSRNILPLGPQDPAHVYISVDLAWTEEKRADFTVAMAVAVDHQGNHWVLDYDRFQISSPTGIYDRLIKFYRKFEEPQTIKSLSGQKYPGAPRY